MTALQHARSQIEDGIGQIAALALCNQIPAPGNARGGLQTKELGIRAPANQRPAKVVALAW